MSKVEKATKILEMEANDNRYGYLWGGWGPYDFDCGHAVIDAWEKAGVPVKSYGGAAWTGNMREAFLKCGFKDITNTVNLSSGVGLKRGDVLINRDLHAAQFIGNNKLVHARSSEGNEISGDQNGREFLIQTYFNYPWNQVLRYPEEAKDDSDKDKETIADETELQKLNGICGPETWKELIERMPTVQNGDVGWAVTALQAMLNYLGNDLDADGEFGPLTEGAVYMFQNHLVEKS